MLIAISNTANAVAIPPQLVRALLIYTGWMTTHYVSAHLYTILCVPLTLRGFLISAFNTAAPHCNALRWCITNGADNITAMWLLLGAWLIGYLPCK